MGLMIMEIPAKNVLNIFTGDNSAFYTKVNKKTGFHETYAWGLN